VLVRTPRRSRRTVEEVQWFEQEQRRPWQRGWPFLSAPACSGGGGGATAGTRRASSRLRLEFRDNAGTWQRIATRVTLVENGTESGATVRLEPIGVLPPASTFRARVEAGFQDIVGQAGLLPLEDFAVAPTRAVEFTSLSSDLLSDEFQEPFDFGGEGQRSFEDTQALFETPAAEWGDGQLSAAFSFEGSGGPNGDFDWGVRTGEIFNFDTTRTSIVGGPDGVPTQHPEHGPRRRGRSQPGDRGRSRDPRPGTQPLRIHATGAVRILGTLDLSGFNAKDVSALDTGNQVETGGAGTAGAGRGGSRTRTPAGLRPAGARVRDPSGRRAWAARAASWV